MLITICVAILFFIGNQNLVNGQGTIHSAHWGLTPGVPAYQCTYASTPSTADTFIVSVDANSLIPINFMCNTTTTWNSNGLPLNVLISDTNPTTTTSQVDTVLNVVNFWFAGNKGYFSYGTVNSGACAGGAYISVALYNNKCEQCCSNNDCGINSQSSSTSLIMFFGGDNCTVWTACTGVTNLQYLSPI